MVIFDYGGEARGGGGDANKPYHLGLKVHKRETLWIRFACLPALDARDCREINPFNNLWL